MFSMSSSLSGPPTAPSGTEGASVVGEAQEPGHQQLAHPRQQVGAQGLGIHLHELGDRIDEGSYGQVAVAGADEGREPRVDLERAREAAALSELDDRGVLLARSVVARLGDVGATRSTLEASPSSSSRAARSWAARDADRCGPNADSPPPETRSYRARVGPPARGRRSSTYPNPTPVTPRAAKSSSHASMSRAYSGVPGTVPPSRTHSSAYARGSSTSRSITHASSDEPTHPRTRSSPDSPHRYSQFPSDCATAPARDVPPRPR